MSEAFDALKSTYDAMIVGARCAGAATALLLARSGLDVLVVEQAARGTDTVSTLALMRAGVLQLSRWQLLDAIKAAGTPPIQTTTFHYIDERVPIRIKPRDGVDALFAPRRTLLDPLLADAASAAGADVAYRVRLKDLLRDGAGRVSGAVVESGGAERRISTAVVIGADGLGSTVAKRVGAEPYRVGAHMSGVIYTRVHGLDIEGYHWHYVPGSSVGVIPTNDGETLVFAAAPKERFMTRLRVDLAAGFREIVEDTAPSVAAAIEAARVSSYRGFAGHPAVLRPAWGPGWALVGDAGYFKDPITAHGITDALRDAELLARAVVSGSDQRLAEFQRVRDDLSVELMTITDEIASYAWDIPRLQALHRALSDEMTNEVLHVSSSGTEGAAIGDAHRGARAPLQ
jgi:2-polyprenyl-6-methoxyphenol hydroxylase-like FAD-dependent oxidoreductase